MKKNKKGAIEGLQALIVPLIGIGIVLAIGFLIIAEAREQIQSVDNLNSSYQSTIHDQGSRASNASADVQDALSDIPGWIPIIVITVIGALLLGLVQRFRGTK